MKNLLRLKFFLSVVIIGVTLLLGGNLLKENNPGFIYKNKYNAKYFDKDGNIKKKKDKPGEAYYFEFIKTRDPRTNTIPVERLVSALDYTKQLTLSNPDGPLSIDWLERGPNNVGGRTRAILVDKNDPTGNTVFAGGVAGGLWRSENISSNDPQWEKVDDFFSNLAVSCIVQNPLNPQEIYFGTGEGWYNIDAVRGLGIWKSTNGGQTFSQLPSTNNSIFHYVQKIVIHPVTGHIFASTRNGGIQRSQNGGNSWAEVLGQGNGALFSRAADIEIGADNSIYASIGIFQTDGIYKSANGESGTWTKLNTAISGFPAAGFNRIELATAPSDANVLYAMVQEGVNYGMMGVYKSINGGATFTQLPNPVDADPLIGPDITRSQAWYDLILQVDPNNANNVYIGGIDLFKSTTGGLSWQQVSHWYGGFTFQEVHADQHMVVFANSDTIYFGNDGGVWRTDNGTAQIPSIKHKSFGYNTVQYYGCAIHPTANTTHFLAGAQDNGSHKFTSAGVNSTIEVTGGDGAFCHIDKDEPQYQFTAYVYNNYFRSTDGGNSFTSVDVNNNGQFINPTDYDDTKNMLFASNTAGNYLRWNNPQTGASTSTVTVTAFGGQKITAVSVSPNTPGKVFFGLDSGRVVRVDSADIGTAKTGVDLSAGLPAGYRMYVSSIAVEDGNDNHIIVTYSNYGVNSIWESFNGGSTWTSVEGNLPDMPVRWVVFSPQSNDHAIIATELGVWSTDNLNGSSTQWGPSNNGLANVSTHMIQVRESDGMMIAATHGRGLFSSNTFTSAYADFSVSKTVSYRNKNISFIDNSNQATSWFWEFGDGQTSNQQNPVHAYQNPGKYTVKLTINGSIPVTKPDLINILPSRGTPYLLANGGNFDTSATDFAPQTINGTPFERGNSTVSGKDGTHSGNFAWVTGLEAPMYADNTHSMLYSPEFNFTATGTYTIRFWGKYSTEATWDGFRVEATTDRGETWFYIGTLGPNWYNTPNNVLETVFPVGEPYFSGVVLNYTEYFTDISNLAGNSSVGFRFVFKTDGNTPDIGVALDDFQVQGPPNVITNAGNELTGLPDKFELNQNYPNPFNPSTEIKYALPKQVKVTIKIYDISGREIAKLINSVQNPGFYNVSFDGSGLASGVYFYNIIAGDFKESKKMMLIK